MADATGIGLLHDRRVPGTGGTIDHLIIASAGVFIRRPESFRGVRLEGPRSLKRLITRQALLDAEAIDRLTGTLATALPSK